MRPDRSAPRNSLRARRFWPAFVPASPAWPPGSDADDADDADHADEREGQVLSPARREGLVYGVGALHAAARGDRMMWALHRAALSNGIVPVIPAVAVAEGYRTEARGDRIAELLDGTEVEPFSSDAARRSGELAARCDTTDLAVIAVIELADRRNCAVVAQRQAVLRNAAALLGHDLVLYAV